MGEGDQTRCLHICHLSKSYIDVSVVPYHAVCYHRASTSLNSLLLTCRVQGFMRLSPYPYTFISSIQLETRLVRPGNVFPVINNPMSVLTGPDEELNGIGSSYQMPHLILSHTFSIGLRSGDCEGQLSKSLVYADKPQTLDHLEDNIRRVIADIQPQMLEKVIENWTSRLDYIRASRGSPMPEIIFKM
ncbi:uncharacterized protein TNCV_574341 [Trichonephila clavipes]|nr:uncharacterized protein TNCV_574341 [Trichonephila clavipes]